MKQLNSRTGGRDSDEIGRGDICVSRSTRHVVRREFQSWGYRRSRCRNAAHGQCELKRHRVTDRPCIVGRVDLDRFQAIRRECTGIDL